MTSCTLCNPQDYEVIYDGVIRDGVVGIKTTIPKRCLWLIKKGRKNVSGNR